MQDTNYLFTIIIHDFKDGWLAEIKGFITEHDFTESFNKNFTRFAINYYLRCVISAVGYK